MIRVHVEPNKRRPTYMETDFSLNTQSEGIAMKCQICYRHKGVHLRRFSGVDFDILVCEKCRREGWPTPEEGQADSAQEQYRAERQAEIDAGCG